MFRNITKKLLFSVILAGLIITGNSVNAHEFSDQVVEEAQNFVPTKQAKLGELLAFPELTEYVRYVGNKLARVSDYPNITYEFTILNSPAPNAWAFRDGKIAISRGLLMELNNESELAAVLSHEIGHEVAYKRQEEYEKERTFSALGNELKSVHSLMDVRNLINKLIERKGIRDEEYAADHDGIRFMARAGYDLNGAITLQEFFLRNHQNTDWVDSFFETHPSPDKRIMADHVSIMENPSTGNFLGQEEYISAAKSLLKAREAYDMYEDGITMIDTNPQQARALASQALKIVPNEALFHGLLGKAEGTLKDYNHALLAFNEAIKFNKDYFEFHLNKGMLLFTHQEFDKAREELEISLKLYATPRADYLLGLIDIKESRFISAFGHLEAASLDNSWIGYDARIELAKLELTSNFEN